jgi:hypothetical protein
MTWESILSQVLATFLSFSRSKAALALFSVFVGWLLSTVTQNLLEKKRQRRERLGVMRQIRILLARIQIVVNAFSYSYKTLGINDVNSAYAEFSDRIAKPDAGVVLTDDECDALDNLRLSFGLSINMQHQLMDRWSTEDAGPKPVITDEDNRRYRLAQNYAALITPLLMCASYFGDAELIEEVKLMGIRFDEMAKQDKRVVGRMAVRFDEDGSR